MRKIHWEQVLRTVARGILFLGVTAAIWAWSYRTFLQASRMSDAVPLQPLGEGSFLNVLFGSVSIALFVISVSLALRAIAVWRHAPGTIFEESLSVQSKLTGLIITLLLSLITAIWAWSYKIFVEASAKSIQRLDQDSLFTALFGASSIALFILSLMLALLAVFGWQSIKGFIEQRVDDTMREQKKSVDAAIETRTRALENELKGRVATILGHALGQMSLNPGTFVVGDRDRLEEAVQQCEAGYKHLKEIGEGAEALALNNLIFYSCVFAQGMPKENTEFMLEKARSLREAGQEHNSTMLKLTACRVLLEYEAKPQEKVNARKTLMAIANSSSASQREKKEAAFYLKEYPGLGGNILKTKI
jgi:hypothetical protein